MSEMEQETSIKIKRRTSSRLQIMKHQLGFKSLDEMLLVLTQISTVQGWTKEQLVSMAIPEESGSASSERELYEKLNKPREYSEKSRVKGRIKKKTEES